MCINVCFYDAVVSFSMKKENEDNFQPNVCVGALRCGLRMGHHLPKISSSLSVRIQLDLNLYKTKHRGGTAHFFSS